MIKLPNKRTDSKSNNILYRVSILIVRDVRYSYNKWSKRVKPVENILDCHFDRVKGYNTNMLCVGVTNFQKKLYFKSFRSFLNHFLVMSVLDLTL